jgi:hypothetical protein
MQADLISLNAAAFMDSTGSIVATAGRLADELMRHLRDGHSVNVSMRGMRGVASSYFNVILQRITKELGMEALDRLHFQWDSAAQQVVYQRSLKSLLATNPG